MTDTTEAPAAEPVDDNPPLMGTSGRKKSPLRGTPAFKRLADLVDANHAKSMYLKSFGIELMDDSILLQRLNTLIEYLLPEDTEDRIEFEIMFAELAERSLAKGQEFLNKAKLAGHPMTQAANLGFLPPDARGEQPEVPPVEVARPSGLIVPGAPA